jgi:hypothetical protein
LWDDAWAAATDALPYLALIAVQEHALDDVTSTPGLQANYDSMATEMCQRMRPTLARWLDALAEHENSALEADDPDQWLAEHPFEGPPRP